MPSKSYVEKQSVLDLDRFLRRDNIDAEQRGGTEQSGDAEQPFPIASNDDVDADRKSLYPLVVRDSV